MFFWNERSTCVPYRHQNTVSLGIYMQIFSFFIAAVYWDSVDTKQSPLAFSKNSFPLKNSEG